MRGEKVGALSGHENRVSCLGVSNDGISLCTGSWDSLVSHANGRGAPPLRFQPPFLRLLHLERLLTTLLAQNLGLVGGDNDPREDFNGQGRCLKPIHNFIYFLSPTKMLAIITPHMAQATTVLCQ